MKGNSSIETQESLGTYLKKERESRNLSLQEVAKNTKISEQILTAIEEDRYDRLPSPTYVKGFLSAYARSLGIDPNDVVLRYQNRGRARQAPLVDVPRVPDVPVEETSSPKAKDRRLLLWGGLGIVLVVFILLYFAFPLSPPSPAPPPPQPEAPVRPAPEERPPVIPPQPAETVPQKEGTSFSLQVKATEETWIRIGVNDRPDKEMILKPGENLSYSTSDEIRLLVGNAGGLDLTFNGKTLERFGKSGEVVTLKFTPRGAEVKPHPKPKPPSE
jgi:cytoskeleton protein RodZ